jgi:hypothetical protein
MREVALCFSRDSSVLSNAEYLVHAPLYMNDEGSGFIPGASSNEYVIVFSVLLARDSVAYILLI